MVWGYNKSGKLGLRDKHDRHIPTLKGKAKDVSNGEYHTLVIPLGVKQCLERAYSVNWDLRIITIEKLQDKSLSLKLNKFLPDIITAQRSP